MVEFLPFDKSQLPQVFLCPQNVTFLDSDPLMLWQIIEPVDYCCERVIDTSSTLRNSLLCFQPVVILDSPILCITWIVPICLILLAFFHWLEDLDSISALSYWQQLSVSPVGQPSLLNCARRNACSSKIRLPTTTAEFLLKFDSIEFFDSIIGIE